MGHVAGDLSVGEWVDLEAQVDTLRERPELRPF
jgi:hypothetical protein